MIRTWSTARTNRRQAQIELKKAPLMAGPSFYAFLRYNCSIYASREQKTGFYEARPPGPL